MENDRKRVRVAAAVIRKDGLVFATQRGYGAYKDWWEFPGGKIEDGETPEEALIREIREELDADITVDEYITTVEYDYPEFHLSMACYRCSLKNEHLTLLEHEAAKWMRTDSLRQVNWLPADVAVVDILEAENSPLNDYKNIEKRVAFFEQIYDELRAAVHERADSCGLKRKLSLLEDYYSSGEWRKDYEADEAGLLPAGLKRGVLSQDGVYNLLAEWEADDH